MFDSSNNDIDKLFQQGSKNHDFEYKEESWAKMEDLLNKTDSPLYLWWLGAFLIFIFAGIGLYFHLDNNTIVSESSIVDSIENSTKKISELKNISELNKSREPKSSKNVDNTENENIGSQSSNKEVVNYNTNNEFHDSNNNKVLINENSKLVNSVAGTAKQFSKNNTINSTASINSNKRANLSPHNSNENTNSSLTTVSINNNRKKHDSENKISPLYSLEQNNDSVNFNSKLVKLPIRLVLQIENKKYSPEFTHTTPYIIVCSFNSVNQNHFYLGLIVSSESTAVGFNHFSRLNWKLGGQLEYRFKQKYGIGLGAIYNQKTYQTAGEDYSPPKGFWTRGVIPNSVDASCNVLEIPLQLAYFPSGYDNNGLVINVGLNSYLMLKERYNYSYENSEPDLIRTWGTTNENNHWLGIAQASIGYQRNIKFHVNHITVCSNSANRCRAWSG